MVGVEVTEAEIIPLYHEIYSQVTPGFSSRNAEILKTVDVVSRHIVNRGIYVLDRGGDRHKLFYAFSDEGKRFLVRLVGDLNLIYRGGAVGRELSIALCGDCTQGGGRSGEALLSGL